MVEHLVERLLAQTRLVHRDKPLVGGAEDRGLLAAPAVRIGVVDLDLGKEGYRDRPAKQ